MRARTRSAHERPLCCVCINSYELGALLQLGWSEFRKKHAVGALRAEEAARRNLGIEVQRQQARAEDKKRKEQQWLIFEASQRAAMQQAIVETEHSAQQARFCRDQVRLKH